MDDSDDDWEASEPFLDGQVTLQDVAPLLKADEAGQIYVPRYVSWDDIPNEENGDVWELAIGLVPTTGIRTVIMEWKGTVYTLEFEDGEWNVTDEVDKDKIHPQIFAAQIKPYVSVYRVLREKSRTD